MTQAEAKTFVPPTRVPTLAEDVYRQIRTAIVERTLAPGQRVTESALADLLDVSKTPVREALMRLREVGLVRSDGRRGLRVVDLSDDLLADAYDVREALELAGIERAAIGVTENDLHAIEEAADRSLLAAQGGDGEAFARWDAAFHLQLARLSGNEHLLKLLRDTLDLIAAIRQGSASSSQLEASTGCAGAHAEIVGALRRGDAAACADRLRQHIRHGRERSTVEPPTPDV